MYGNKTWRVYCEDEAAHFEVVSDAVPTQCPNNGGHTITPAKTTCLVDEDIPVTKVLDELQTTDATQGVLQETAIPDGSVVIIEAAVQGFRTNGVDQAAYVRRAAVYRRAGGNATLLGSVDPTFTAESDGTWDCTIGVDGTNARILVTGASGKDITWSGRCYYM